MHIIHVASELAPVAKVGGLADVLYGLSKELVKTGHEIEIILPKYDCIHYGYLKDLKPEHRDLWSFEGNQRYHNTIWSARMENLKVFLIEPHHPRYYFSRGCVYGCHDDIDRFAYFSRSVLEYLLFSGKQPDVLHIHDWATALMAPLYKEVYAKRDLKIGKTVLTIHNLEHQGKCSSHNLSLMGLKGEALMLPEKMQDPYSPSLINLLKGGIEHADVITTVSPNYEREIKTLEGGCGLHTALQKHEKKLKGILNGIDEEFWNPAKDSKLAANYCTRTSGIKEVLEGKRRNRKQLRKHLGLEEKDVPIVAAVTRLVTQKGPHLLHHAILKTLERGGQFVLLGSTFSSDIENSFRQLQKQFSKGRNAAICLDKDEALAHLIFAGADMLIVPSLFEPCGLTQLIGMRYGTVPIVRSTGGLADTVFDIDTAHHVPLDERNGFTFDFPDTLGVDWALNRALDCWFKDQKAWQRLMLQGMQKNFSWQKSAQDYLDIYTQ